jgi:hypothetical protein
MQLSHIDNYVRQLMCAIDKSKVLNADIAQDIFNSMIENKSRWTSLGLDIISNW